MAESFRTIIRTKKPYSNEIIRYDIPDGKGGFLERYWKPVHYPILDTDDNVAFILQTSSDVTSEVVVERDMRQMREQLQEALEIGRVGSWVWDVATDKVVADGGLAKMFGVSRQQAANGMPIEVFIQAIHPDDQPDVIKAIKRAVHNKGVFEYEYRTVSTNGEIRWVLARGKVEEKNGRRLFPGVIVDITERRNLEAQVELARQQDRLNRQETANLQQRNEELEAISRTKDEFVALASHQLRTPATAVKQYLGMVLQGYVGTVDELQTDMLTKAFESNERQIQIINQILNAARVDTGRLVLTPASIDLTLLVGNITEEMHTSMEQRKHTFSVKLPKSPIMITADRAYLRMAIENLLHNACIYTPEGGKITAKLLKIGSHYAQLSVTDNGVGIKKADIGKLFEKFSRIHNPLSVQAGGSGIGLYLTAEIVRLHGGNIEVTSKINKGTTFTVTLPLSGHEFIAQRST